MPALKLKVLRNNPNSVTIRYTIFYYAMTNNIKKPVNLRNKALDFLSRRDYSYQELFNKLRQYSNDDQEIISILDEMVAKKFLNEERYIEAFIHAKAKKFGSLKIRYLLNSKVDNTELIDQLYEQIQVDELQIASEQLTKKYRQPPTGNLERAKCIRFLLSRGFSMEIAIQAVNNYR